MKVDALYLPLAVAQAHDHAIGSFCRNFQRAGQGFSFDDQRMISRGGKILRQPAEDCLGVMLDRASLAVHQLRSANYPAAEGFADGLMAEANAEDWNLPGKSLDQRNGNAGLARGAGAGRNHNSLRPQIRDFIERDFVIAAHHERLAHLAKVLRQVVGEGIVVVEQQDHRDSRLDFLTFSFLLSGYRRYFFERSY